EPGRLSPPIWPCTKRGFPCLVCRHTSGGLLPHLFTLTCRAALEDVSQVSLFDVTELTPPAVYFLWHFPSPVAQTSVCVPVHCLRECSRNSIPFRLRRIRTSSSPRYQPPGVTRRVAHSLIAQTA